MAIEGELAQDHLDDLDTVDVSVHDGIVTLRGWIPTLLVRRRAVVVALGVVGVRSVVDQTTLEVRSPGDTELRRRVEAALVADPVIRFRGVSFLVGSVPVIERTIEVSARDGIVTLDGTVDSMFQRAVAVRTAEGVEGVLSVQCLLGIDPVGPESDSEIAAEVRSRLGWEPLVDDGLIEVLVLGGQVVLAGSVGSDAERRRAAEVAAGPGVVGVSVDRLDVQERTHDPMQREGWLPRPADEEVRASVREAFVQDPRVAPANPEIQVKHGIVTLTGVVGSREARRSAESDARNTFGVLMVRNHLDVRPRTGRS
jgi:osmotically-inducible protein OsmY